MKIGFLGVMCVIMALALIGLGVYTYMEEHYDNESTRRAIKVIKGGFVSLMAGVIWCCIFGTGI